MGATVRVVEGATRRVVADGVLVGHIWCDGGSWSLTDAWSIDKNHVSVLRGGFSSAWEAEKYARELFGGAA